MGMSTAKTVADYLKGLPADRRAALSAVRDTIKQNLPPGYEEGMQWGMISYYVPLKRYPDTYNGQPLCVAGLASQKQYMAVYLMGVYSSPVLGSWFRQAYRDSGKKLDMGQSCVRFKTLDDLPLDVVGRAIAKVPVDALTAAHDAVHGAKKKKKPAAKKPAAKKARA